MNSNKGLFLAFLSSLFLLTSCASFQSPLKSMLLKGEVPQFKGYITPILVPIQLEYKPASSKFRTSLVASLDVSVGSRQSSKIMEYTMIGSGRVSRLGDSFVWDTKITKVIEDGQHIAPNRPIMEAMMLTDKYGSIKEIEATYPAIDKGMMGEDKFEKFDAAMIKKMETMIKRLPEKPVRSGDVVSKISLKKFLIDEMNLPLEDEEEIKDVEGILKGWGYLKDKKVLVISLDHISNIGSGEGEHLITLDKDLTEKIVPGNIQITMNGYSLLDPNTLQIIKSEALVVMKITITDKEKFDIRAIMSFLSF